MVVKYWLKINKTRYKQVSKREYIAMEEFCGFVSKFKNQPACSSFGLLHSATGIYISGKTVKK